MPKTIDANQTQKIDRRFLQPIYFVHILGVGAGAETLYFSDRTFKYNGHDYEDNLTELPALVQSIERFGGYLNIRIITPEFPHFVQHSGDKFGTVESGIYGQE